MSFQEDPFSNKASKPDTDDISTRFRDMDVGDSSRNSGGMGKPSAVPKSKMTLGKKDRNAFKDIMTTDVDDPSVGKRGGVSSSAAAAAAGDPVTISIEETVKKEAWEAKETSYVR